MQKGTVINVLNCLMFLIITSFFGYMVLHENAYRSLNYLVLLTILLAIGLLHSLIAFKKCNLLNKLFVTSFIMNVITIVIWVIAIRIIETNFSSWVLFLTIIFGLLYLSPIIYIIGYYIYRKVPSPNQYQ